MHTRHTPCACTAQRKDDEREEKGELMSARDSEGWNDPCGRPRVDLAVDIEFGDAGARHPEITICFSVQLTFPAFLFSELRLSERYYAADNDALLDRSNIMNLPVPDVFPSGRTADPFSERAHTGRLYSERYVPIICARRVRQFTANKDRAFAESGHVPRLAPLSRDSPSLPPPLYDWIVKY